VKTEEFEQLTAFVDDQQNCEDAVRDAARFIASLTAVDGAVLLTDALEISSFGMEIMASLLRGDLVHVAHTTEAAETKKVRFAEYGTRQRSAFRFVASMEPSVGIILSQYGGVKAVRQVRSKLVILPYFQTDFTAALSQASEEPNNVPAWHVKSTISRRRAVPEMIMPKAGLIGDPRRPLGDYRRSHESRRNSRRARHDHRADNASR
jgi:hypothetical protein